MVYTPTGSELTRVVLMRVKRENVGKPVVLSHKMKGSLCNE